MGWSGKPKSGKTAVLVKLGLVELVWHWLNDTCFNTTHIWKRFSVHFLISVKTFKKRNDCDYCDNDDGDGDAAAAAADDDDDDDDVYSYYYCYHYYYDYYRAEHVLCSLPSRMANHWHVWGILSAASIAAYNLLVLSREWGLLGWLWEVSMDNWLVVGPPLSKIWKSIGMISNPIYGKIKFMFQTTNQIIYRGNRLLIVHSLLSTSKTRTSATSATAAPRVIDGQQATNHEAHIHVGWDPQPPSGRAENTWEHLQETMALLLVISGN